MKKIIFMGTPEFAIPILEQLKEQYQVVAVVTQPDRPVGRKRVITPPPVKKKAVELDIPVYQPEKLRYSSELEEILAIEADLLVTAAYGQILPTSLLQHAKYGAINVHASLLPEYRGGAPVHYAVLEGKKETGVTIMYMVDKLDAGDMIAKRSLPITDEDTTGTLFAKLSLLGAELLMDTLPDFFAGKITAEKQDESKATFASNITRAQEKIDWQKEAKLIFNQIRGLNPFPVAYTTLSGKPFKIWMAKIAEQTTTKTPGTFISISKSQFGIAAGDGGIILPTIIQPAGKPKMETAAFMQGVGKALNEKIRFGD